MNTLLAPIRAARVSPAGTVRGGGAPSLPSRPRVAFTLVEVLVVVVILGLVFSLIVGGLGAVSNSARNATVENELYQLDCALLHYSGLYGELPPTMLSSYTAASPSFDQTKFLEQVFTRHVRRMFPRYNGYYDDIEQAINHATVPEHTDSVYNLYGGCDLQNLDAAESLVFWLGGLPRIIWATAERYEVELTGFAADPAAPLLPKVDQPQRTNTLFDFDHRRLVDSDMDGWPEYVPDFDGAGPNTPPFVYFDAASYTWLPSYPMQWHPSMSSAADNWGLARPYLKTYTPNDPQQHPVVTDFAAADGFQLICAGADGKYSQLDETTALAFNEAKNALTVYPRGQFTVRGSTTWQPIAAAQYDNLANFLDSTLEHALGAPQ